VKQADCVISGQLVLEDGLIGKGSLAVKDGRVIAIGETGALPASEQHFDFGDLLVMPGVVDVHFHALGDEKEGFSNATRSAAAGGVTTVNDLGWDLGGGPTNRAGIAKKIARTEKEVFIDFSLSVCLVPEHFADIAEAASSGITGYKLLMASMHDPSVWGGFRAVNDAELLDAFQRIAKTNLPALVHAENNDMIHANIRRLIDEGRWDPAAHGEARPPITETEAVNRAIEIARAAGTRLHLVHMSVPRSIDLISRARAEGTKVTGETTAHYLTLTEERWKDVGELFKIDPPLRSAECRDGLWDKLRSGGIALVASDHAPHPRVGAERIFDNPSGSPGIETMLPILYSEGVAKGRIGIRDLVRLLSLNPSMLLGIYPTKGTLRIGSDADMVVFDPEERWTIHGSELHAQSGWTVFEGLEVVGRPVATFVRGILVFRDGEIVGKPGTGKFVKRSAFYNL
jgi:allantoinase